MRDFQVADAFASKANFDKKYRKIAIKKYAHKTERSVLM